MASKAILLYREKYHFDDGSIREMVLWKLPEDSGERPHGLKYRLYYGTADGVCLVRYDNEAGKGDHRHYGEDYEEPCLFSTPEQLVEDFLADVDRYRRRGNE